MVRHVIWDWNGTLVDDVSLCVQILNQELKAHQIEEISIPDYKQKFFFPVACYYKKLGLPYFGFKYEALAIRYISEYRKRFKECQLHDGAFKTLEWLQTRGISQSILSAGKKSDLDCFVKHFALDSFFCFIDGAKDIEARGKDERAHTHLSEMGINPEDVLLVGDTCHDWEVAQIIGCRSLLFTLGHVGSDRLKRDESNIITSLSEVCNWVSH
jgi:phosphoglycolate phosphatase